ncbi:damage-inducible protein DinB [Martelella lutilitoris]|uniref:Damage-inducible protein DinB n=1 Tax=Martelella lutilitoris TaxID=2583532 RepID=A0A5C4JN43_9HYPH|nr:DinB family protein [Martelella lutilitoris]TNB46876.1 damage-inducible protein DinB [Martelella lutilitoris]
MLQHYRMFAAYNAWANALVYDAAAGLSDDERKRDLGAFFRSVHATLNHVLYADRVWMTRFEGGDTGPVKLDTILHDDFETLREDRAREDRKIIAFIDGMDEARIAGTFSYQRGDPPESHTDRFEKTLAHFFNHQTHHRGQAHAMLTMLGQPSLAIDLSYFLRSEGGRPFA